MNIFSNTKHLLAELAYDLANTWQLTSTAPWIATTRNCRKL
jgi:hypothetical protein